MTSTIRIRVLLADDHTLLRQGLRALLEREADIKVIGEAASGKEVIEKAEALRPDVIVMDDMLPGLNRVEATRKIISDHPDIEGVILLLRAGEDYVEVMPRAGGSGYVLKDAPASDLLSAIRAVAAGDARTTFSGVTLPGRPPGAVSGSGSTSSPAPWRGAKVRS